MKNEKEVQDFQSNTENQIKVEEAIKTLIEYIGDDISREGLLDTPSRIRKAWEEWGQGYKKIPFEFKTFSTSYDGILVKHGIEFRSFCEHHLAIYYGTIDFAYIPNGKAIGLSKISRFIRHRTSKLTIQENLTDDLINEFCNIVNPKGAMIILKAFHTCEGTRGARQKSKTITSAVRGIFKESLSTKQEALELIKNSK